jgi:undecaprenyl diphosphate synthase
MMAIERIIYHQKSLSPDIEKVKPEELRMWLQEIERKWEVIPDLEAEPDSLHSLTVICDGNRRAAEVQDLDPFFGHRAGVEVIKGVARACRQWDIPYLTFWTWSTENWKRDSKQVKYVMSLAAQILTDPEFVDELVENHVHFVHLGREDRLPAEVLFALTSLEDKTAEFDKYWLNLAMDYGGLDEIGRAFIVMNEMIQKEEIDVEEIRESPEIIYNFLDTTGQPNPDLIVRTGVKDGEIPHTSGLMPLQSAYACWDFVPDLFPSLTPQTLADSIQKFTEYERRFGK